MNEDYRDEKTLRKLYHDKGMSQQEVADELGVSRGAIRNQMDRHDIETRPKGGETLRKNGPWDDPKVLRELYHGEELSLRDVADSLGCTWNIVLDRMKEFGIERRGKTEYMQKDHAVFYTDKRGYEAWIAKIDGVSTPVRIHRLLAIAKGKDPHDVFSGDYDTHHLNDIPWDNRPNNIMLLDADEHRNINRKKRHNGGISTTHLTGGQNDE